MLIRQCAGFYLPRLCWASLRSILTLETISLRISRYCSMNKLVLLRMFDDSDCKLKKQIYTLSSIVTGLLDKARRSWWIFDEGYGQLIEVKVSDYKREQSDSHISELYLNF